MGKNEKVEQHIRKVQGSPSSKRIFTEERDRLWWEHTSIRAVLTLVVEIFSLVVKHTSIRAVLALVATWDLHLEQMNVKIAFLHGDLEEQIYM